MISNKWTIHTHGSFQILHFIEIIGYFQSSFLKTLKYLGLNCCWRVGSGIEVWPAYSLPRITCLIMYLSCTCLLISFYLQMYPFNWCLYFPHNSQNWQNELVFCKERIYVLNIFSKHSSHPYYPVVPAVVGTTSSYDMTDFETSGWWCWNERLSWFCHIFRCISHFTQPQKHQHPIT